MVDGRGRVSDASLGYFLLRVTLGVNIAMHGVARILSGTEKFAAGMAHTFEGTHLPFVYPFALVLPWVEAVVGLLVLVGLFRRWSLVAGALLMVVLTFGSALHQDWEVTGLQMIYAAVYAGLVAFLRWDVGLWMGGLGGGNSRFPLGMTARKARATTKAAANSRFPLGMTERKGMAIATARAATGWHLWFPTRRKLRDGLGTLVGS